MSRYFKLVALCHDPEWYRREFNAGRARFGWSQPGRDLRRIKQKDVKDLNDDERVTWKYTKFLIERITPGDRIVVQTQQPLENFLIGEVIGPGYDWGIPKELLDFNHVLHIKPLTPQPIPVNSKAVSSALKHDLSKRGQYYEIYPEASISELDILAAKLRAGTLDFASVRKDQDTLDETLREAKRLIAGKISRDWPAKNFERFCEFLCREMDYVEVKERRDIGRGWDMLIRIINPVTQSILMDDIPVQCKNYSGDVTSKEPIDDMARAIRNSESQLAYLFILGHLSPDFRKALELRQEALTKELGRPVLFELVDEDRIAELYVAYATRRFDRSESAA
jgi:hypothetical protein